MWRMQSGNRVLTPAEWEVYIAGLATVRAMIEDDICYDTNDADTGIPIFDRCSPEQKIALLADVSQALHEPSVPFPKHTAVNEGAAAAVLGAFLSDLTFEIEEDENIDIEFRHYNRGLLLAAFAGEADFDLPEVSDTDMSEWELLFQLFHDRIFWDQDYAMADDLLDLPPDQRDAALQNLAIDRDYFATAPREPNEAELIKARQVLARMVGCPVTDDAGFYRYLEDHYHGLMVGPCSEQELATWENHPWVEEVGCTDLSSDCRYEKWTTAFAVDLPEQPFELCFAPIPDTELPERISVERFGSQWVIRDQTCGLWCGLMDNAWTDEPDDDDAILMFATDQQARLAYLHANRMYSERAARRKAAFEKLGFHEPE